ncbi:MAG: DUF21 domain-containing protein [Thermoguttaceae bacterium]|nr:DUF21 domain-containing protein [Thermoguttaceae bacterium]
MDISFAILAAAEGVAEQASSAPPSTAPSWENWAILLLSVAIALGVSFLCSLCEAAFLSLSPGQVEEIAELHPSRGRVWTNFKTHMEYPIAVILLLNTSAHTIGATVAGAQIHYMYGNAMVTAFSIVFTWLMLQYTEILPKTIGVRNNLYVCQLATWPMRVLIWVFTPVVWLLYLINRPFEGAKKNSDSETTLSELAALVGVAQSSNLLDKTQERIMLQTSKLHLRTASEIMVSALDVTFISSKQTLMEAILVAHIDPHTRFPVIDGDNVNKVLGYVNFKEMVAWARTSPDEPNVLPILRPVNFVNEDEEVTDALHLFVEQHAHLAIVQDEQKHTLGIVTLEDIVEELVGDLDDDFNADEKIPESSDGGRMASLPKFINDLSEHVFIIGGGASMKEVISVLNKEKCCGRWYGDAPSGTISQWLLTQIDGALKPNKRVSVNGWDFIVRRTRHNKVFDALVLPYGQNEALREESQS